MKHPADFNFHFSDVFNFHLLEYGWKDESI